MEHTQNAISWFEIPVTDFERAQKFYSAIFDYQMPEMPMGPFRMGFFISDQQSGVGGAIVQGEGYTPSKTGSMVYLNGGSDLSTVLNRVEQAGGKIVVPKTQITPDLGYFATFSDTEGNHVSLHSMA
jgi:predicted enzyme related to lactoylglutathione lyase